MVPQKYTNLIFLMTNSQHNWFSKYLAKLVSPLAGNSSSFIKNSSHFAEMISGQRVVETTLRVSFDVKSLFTNVLVEEVMPII